MKEYVVIVYFTDLQDNGHAYNVGDKFPRNGVEVSPKRLAELSSVHNKRGKALIQEVKKSEPKKEQEITSASEEASAEVEVGQKPKRSSAKKKRTAD